jgi:hypothetical protein
MTRAAIAARAALAMLAAPLPAVAWDSVKHNPTHPTHSYLTEWAIRWVNQPEVMRYRKQLVEGANQELHELPVKGRLYGIDLDKKRIEHKGTNAGTDDIAGWWQDALAAYRAGSKPQAYFLTGIMLHMIEDMGVPAHANGVYHQGTLTEFDNFEFIAFSNWKPDFKRVDKKDPGFADPPAYYAFSKAWTHEDAPDYHDRNAFAKTWLTASAGKKQLVRDREARTATVAGWALKSAFAAFKVTGTKP